MIFNVSGRTDIVNYYTPWFLNRLDEGFVYTRNPYNPKQLTKYDLSTSKVDAFIFCSKNYEPILDDIQEIDSKYPIYCHYTITGYGNDIEANVPSIDESIDTLISLSEIIGFKKISWRYDPIFLTEKYDINHHLDTFRYMSSRLDGHISSCIFSFIDMYQKVIKNMPGVSGVDLDDKIKLLEGLSSIVKGCSFRLQCCAVGDEYADYGIHRSGCVTSKILEDSNNLRFKNVKHTGSREGCMCIPWRDFGQYDSCPNACKYCYANKNPLVAKRNFKLHDSSSPLLIGDVLEDDVVHEAKQSSFLLRDKCQTTLF
ncbi:DUF1848 domain-containing protein [Methanosphaera sp. ISO3-F5]|uniref:DUF1848 domain-containing protein n=1 Tax=Methanosphaera sp. ISO3-F5 TaxID=1452353 RepID=UPI002B259F7E|nr:DUF1848 domain-containing protein [Methanosphaera sp. ISO3-F5]WQH63786.1 DUF1848 domain-containing protein [Methanosphaera sp. ISO3-F5]